MGYSPWGRKELDTAEGLTLWEESEELGPRCEFLAKAEVEQMPLFSLGMKRQPSL